jgi:hypothetical protein
VTWQIPLLLQVVITYIGNPIVIKKSTGLPGRTPRLVLMFLVNASLAWLLLAVFPASAIWDERLLMVGGIGVMNSVANYAHWRAADVSLSRTSVMAQGDDIIALMLGYIFLGESALLTPLLVTGLVLCMGSAVILSIRKREDGKPPPRSFLGWVAVYCTLWGIAVFSTRYFGVSGVPVPSFLVGWYTGSFAGSLVVAAVMGKEERKGGVTWNGFGWVLALCSVSITGLGLAYWVKCLVPITVVQPIVQVAESVLPTFIGLLIFKEAKNIDLWQRTLFAAGIAGSVVLGLSY